MIRSVDSYDVDPPPADPCDNVRMGVPSGDWSRDELYERARWEHKQIDKSETYAPRYWFFGKALLEVRKDFNLHQWKSWRKTNKLDRTRCGRAQLLARAFDAADDLHDLALLAALTEASRRLGLTRRRLALDARLRRWLKTTKTKAETRLAELSGVAAPGELRPFIADLTYALLEIDRACLAAETARSLNR